MIRYDNFDEIRRLLKEEKFDEYDLLMANTYYKYFQDIRKAMLKMDLDIENIVEFTNRMYFLDRNNYDEVFAFLDEFEEFVISNVFKFAVTGKLLKEFDDLVAEFKSYIDRQKLLLKDKLTDMENN